MGGKEWEAEERFKREWIYICLWLIHGEGNGTPLQCSCLENPRDGGAWWAAVYGVAQSRTQLAAAWLIHVDIWLKLTQYCKAISSN